MLTWCDRNYRSTGLRRAASAGRRAGIQQKPASRVGLPTTVGLLSNAHNSPQVEQALETRGAVQGPKQPLQFSGLARKPPGSPVPNSSGAHLQHAHIACEQLHSTALSSQIKHDDYVAAWSQFSKKAEPWIFLLPFKCTSKLSMH